MAKLYPSINGELRVFIEKQHMFFVASAPLGPNGHVNLSPKGLDCLRILSPERVAYLDLTGSGNETSAHLRENGRITFMFCAFAGPPRILRLYGRGHTVLPGTAEWDALRPSFGEFPGVRQIFVADITRVQTSCGFAVPHYDYVGQRQTLIDWANAKRPEQLDEYRAEKNMTSIDGLPTALGSHDE